MLLILLSFAFMTGLFCSQLSATAWNCAPPMLNTIVSMRCLLTMSLSSRPSRMSAGFFSSASRIAAAAPM